MLQYTPFALVMIGASLVSLLTEALVWQRRSTSRTTAFFFLLNAVAFWCLMNAAELCLTSLPAKLALTNLSYLSTVSIPTGWLIFILQYTNRDKWLTRRNFGLLVIFPTITYLLILTNALHHTFYTEIGLTSADGMVMLVLGHGPVFWIHVVYSYALLVIGAALLIQTLLQSPQLYRGQAVWMLIGTFSPWVANAAYVFDFSALPPYVDGTPLAFTITGAAYAWNIYRYRLMDIVPVAKGVVIDNLSSIILVLDLNNHVVEANTAALALLGKTSNEVLGQRGATVLSAYPDLVGRFCDVEQARSEISIVRKGAEHTYDLNILPLRNHQGTLTGRVVMLHDISERKAVERMKDRFVSNVSHELRTPITSMMLALYMLRKQPDRSTTYADHLERDLNRLSELIEALLRLSRLDQEYAVLKLAPLDVNGLMNDLAEDRQLLAASKSLALNISATPDLPPVLADNHLLGQAVSVLLTNAINYTPPGGTVTLRTACAQDATGDWVQIQVADTGPGLTQEELPLLFDRFFRGQASNSYQTPGTGLGLSIAREIVERHQGRITAGNREDGPGAVFTLWLPVAREALGMASA